MPTLTDLAQQVLDISGSKPNYTHAFMALLEVATHSDEPYNNELSEAITFLRRDMERRFTQPTLPELDAVIAAYRRSKT